MGDRSTGAKIDRRQFWLLGTAAETAVKIKRCRSKTRKIFPMAEMPTAHETVAFQSDWLAYSESSILQAARICPDDRERSGDRSRGTFRKAMASNCSEELWCAGATRLSAISL